MGFSRRDFLRTSGALAAGTLLNSGCARNRLGGGSDSRPNIVLVFSDEAAPGYLGCYGGDFLTPHLDSLAADGVRFNQAYCTSSVCAPSRYSVFTGQYAGRSTHPGFLGSQPVTRPYSITWNPGITLDTPTVARFLSAAGYYTGFVGKWGVTLADSNAEWDIPRFSRDDDPDDPEVNRRLRRHHEIYQERIKKTGGFEWAGSVLPGNGKHPLPHFNFHPFEWFTRGALDFIDEAARDDRPFFLYSAPTATHGPDHSAEFDVDPRYTPEGKREPFACYPPRESLRRRLEQAGLPVDYAHSGMLYLDEHVGGILKRLRELGVTRDTLVIYVPDHNVEPGKASCYQRGVHVPMLMRWPGRIPAGSTTDELVQITDILPTCLDVAGAAPPPGYRGDGRSILPAAEGGTLPGRDHLYFEIGVARGVLKDGHKYIAYRYRDEALRKMEDGEVDVALDHMESTGQAHSSIALSCFPHYFDPDQLYDLGRDPHEQHNVADDPAYAEVLADLRDTLKADLETFRHPYDLSVPEFMESERFAELVEARQEIGASRVGWWDQSFKWPPEE